MNIIGGKEKEGEGRPVDPFEKERLAREEREGKRIERDQGGEEGGGKGCGCCIVM